MGCTHEKKTLSQNHYRNNVGPAEYTVNYINVDCAPSAQQIPRTRHEYNMACLL